MAALAERPRGFGRIRYKLELSGNLLRLVHPGTILHEWLEEVSPGWQARQAPHLRMPPESARAWLDPATNGNWRTSDISMRSGEVVGLRVACSDSAPHFAPLGRFENLRTLELVGGRLPLAEQWMLAELPIHTRRLRDPRTNGFLLLPSRGPLRVVEIHGGDLQKVFLKDGLNIHFRDNPPDSPPPAWSLRIAGARICDSVHLARLDSLGAVITASRCGGFPRQALAADARSTTLLHHGPDSVYEWLYGKAVCDSGPHVHVGPGFLADSLVSLFRPTLPLDRGYSIPSQVRSAGCAIYDPLGQDIMVDSINVGPWWVEQGMMSLSLFGGFPSFGRLRPKSSRQEAAAFLGTPLLETDSWMVWQSEVTDSMAYVFCEERNQLLLHFDEAGGLDGILVSTDMGCGDC